MIAISTLGAIPLYLLEMLGILIALFAIMAFAPFFAVISAIGLFGSFIYMGAFSIANPDGQPDTIVWIVMVVSCFVFILSAGMASEGM